MHFTKNTGQFARDVAYVANVTEELVAFYKGAGVVRVRLENGKPVSFEKIELFWDEELQGYPLPNGKVRKDYHPELTALDWDEIEPGVPHAEASCYQIVALKGSALAALLNITGDHA
jgi:hypothetical protein